MGGTVFATTVTTLAKDPDSFLYRICRTDDKDYLDSHKDDTGAYLIDRDIHKSVKTRIFSLTSGSRFPLFPTITVASFNGKARFVDLLVDLLVTFLYTYNLHIIYTFAQNGDNKYFHAI